MNISISQLLFLILAINSFFLFVATFNQKRLWPLTVFLFALTVHMGSNFLTQIFTSIEGNYLQGLSFLYGPLFYLFVYKATVKERIPSKVLILHLMPFIVATLVTMFVNRQIQWLIFPTLFTVGIYLYMSFKKLLHYHFVIANTQANDDRKLHWLYVLIFFLTVALILEVARYSLFNNSRLNDVMLAFTVLSLIAFISSFIYFALKNSALLLGISREESNLIPAAHLTKEDIVKNYTSGEVSTLLSYMKDKKPYLNPDLTISMLAEEQPFSPRDLSALINTEFSINFCEFINRYRIREACELLEKDGKSVNLLSLSMDVGFNSKSAFNSAFKQFQGMTPSQFKATKSVQIPESGLF